MNHFSIPSWQKRNCCCTLALCFSATDKKRPKAMNTGLHQLKLPPYPAWASNEVIGDKKRGSSCRFTIVPQSQPEEFDKI
jgi:hypothetical protein